MLKLKTTHKEIVINPCMVESIQEVEGYTTVTMASGYMFNVMEPIETVQLLIEGAL